MMDYQKANRLAAAAGVCGILMLCGIGFYLSAYLTGGDRVEAAEPVSETADANQISIIGGADGPAAIFIASKAGEDTRVLKPRAEPEDGGASPSSGPSYPEEYPTLIPEDEPKNKEVATVEIPALITPVSGGSVSNGFVEHGSDVHTGIDYTAAKGAEVLAAADGTVKLTVENDTSGKGFGKYLVLDHGGGVTTLYAHCGKLAVKKGEAVKQGQTLAEIGSTGDATGLMCHFELQVNGVPTDPRIGVPLLRVPVADDRGSTGFGSYKGHTGIDYLASEGSDITAAADGTVTAAGWDGIYGNRVILDHGGGVQTLYAHCSKLDVRKGETVKAGQKIGEVGTTGNTAVSHCHFELRLSGTPVDPAQHFTLYFEF